NVIDLAAREEKGWAAWRLIEGFDHAWKLVDAIGSRLWFVTNHGAPRYRVVSIDLDGGARDWSVTVPEMNEPLDGATIVGGKLVLSYLKDATSFAQIRALDGTLAKTISLTGLGTASGFTGEPD